MSCKLEPAIWSRDTGQRIPCFDRCQLIITWMSNTKEVHSKPRLHVSLSTCYLEYGRHVARLHRRRRAYAPTSNTASHDNHKKINSWVSFSFLYGYGALLGGPLGQLELCYNLGNSKHFVLLRFNLDIGRNSLRYRGPLAWELTPTSLKQSPSLKNLKNLLKQSCSL